ncbi:hypothetical protein ACWGI9_43085 [Streptomyces sp. NPDC054833]
MAARGDEIDGVIRIGLERRLVQHRARLHFFAPPDGFAVEDGVHVHHLQTGLLPFLADPLLQLQSSLVSNLFPYGGRVHLRADPSTPDRGKPADESTNDRANKPDATCVTDFSWSG